MEIQSDLPELVKIDRLLSGDLYRRKEMVIVEKIIDEENMFFRIAADLSTTIGKGSYGSIHPCSLSIIKDNKILNRSDDVVVKIIQNKDCIKDSDDLYREIIIHCLVYNSANDLAPKIYHYLMNINSKNGNSIKCYNGILQNNISSGSINLYRNRLFNQIKPPLHIVNDHFSMLWTIKETLLDLYKNYKFKHNDLHAGNILFDGFSPKIIDYGESTVDHKFKNETLHVLANRKHVEEFYGVYHKEYEFMYYNYPLSDLHLFIFSSYNTFIPKKNTELISTFVARLESTYSITKLGIDGKNITFDGEIIKKKDEFSQIYKDAHRIIKYLVPNIPSGVKASWDSIFAIWAIFDFRIMSFLYSIYIPDKVNYSSYGFQVISHPRVVGMKNKGGIDYGNFEGETIDYGGDNFEEKTIDYGDDSENLKPTIRLDEDKIGGKNAFQNAVMRVSDWSAPAYTV